MTIKEQIVQIMLDEGYDFISACEEAERLLQLGKMLEEPRAYYIGYTSFTLSPKEPHNV